MKLNFWQILGILLILAGVVGVIYNEFIAEDAPDSPQNQAPVPAAPLPPALAPSSVPSTQP
ncbi:MAG TPA: hypothetical protein VGB55_09655 [Tepidisphaeraceae bacterium]|jgi:drug/metabolite transporter (DMT)-like permease